MSLVSEAIARYHKLIESEPYIDLAWAQELQERIKAQKVDGRGVSPVLRPHFLTNRDYAALERASSVLQSAIERVMRLALANPALLTRLQLLPAERMMAGVDPGYKSVSITNLFDSAVNDGDVRVTGYNAEVPAGVLYGEALADVYYDCPPVKEFRKKYKLKKLGGTKPLLAAIVKAYKEFGGKQKRPSIAIVEFRQPFQSAANSEYAPLAEFLTAEGYPTEVLAPEQLEYRNRELRRGEFLIDIVYRRVNLQDFLVRYDLNHPLMRAYKDRAVCVVNSFRAEMSSKRALLDLLTDEQVTENFPAAERKAIRDLVPWTRMVQAAKTTYKNHTIDLPDFVLKHRAKLVLKPNDDTAGQHPVRGSEVDDMAWEKALRQAMRSPSVVQELVEPTHAVFPLMQFGSLMMKDMVVHVHPHVFLGQAHGASSWLSVAGTAGFSTLSGLAPTFLIEGK